MCPSSTSNSSPQRPDRSRAVALGLALRVLAFVAPGPALLLGAEALLRVTGEAWPTTSMLSAPSLVNHGLDYGIFEADPDPDVVYRHQPGWEGVMFGRQVSLNARGFRGPDVERARLPGRTRLVVLGDSVSFGPGLVAEQRFAARLTEEMEAAGRPAEVVDASVIGWGTRQQLAWLRARGLALKPDVVVVAYCLNDAGIASAVPRGGRPSALRRLHDFLQRRFKAYIVVKEAVDLGGIFAGQAASIDATYLGARRHVWERHRADLDDLAATCRKAGVPVVVVPLPFSQQMNPESPSPSVATLDLVRQWGEGADGVAVVDVLEPLRGLSINGPRPYLVGDPWHLSPAGHAATAAASASAVLRALD